MSVVKVIEVLAESTESFEDAIQNAVDRTSDSVNHVRSAYVNEQTVSIVDGKIDKYRVNLKISFEVKK